MIAYIDQQSMNKSEEKQSKVLSETVAFEKKWFGIKHITYNIGDKVFENYQAAYRPKTMKYPIDGVDILPIFKKKDQTLELIMIANFRPPVGKFCLELPAGIIEDDNFEENAKRELTQETGYRAKRILKIPSARTHCDPWKSSEAGEMFVGVVDENDPNHKIEQDLQSSENIRVFHFPISEDLPEKLSDFAEKRNYVILGRVWTLILGLSLFRLLAN